MKKMKRFMSLMLALVLAMAMGITAFADEGDKNDEVEKGKITITNAIPGQEYKIYRIFDLESYDTTTGAYLYTVNSEWKNFITGTDAQKYISVDNAGYVGWKEGVATDTETVQTFAKLALKYAEDNKITAIDTKTAGNAEDGKETTTVTFDNIDLGYYLLDSSAGALCSLDTTTPEANIEEKNSKPTVDKQVQEDSKLGNDKEWGDYNDADIDQVVNFKTTITAQKGAQNYVLHDKMSEGLTYTKDSVEIKLNDTIVNSKNYTVKTTSLEDDCTFEVVFNKAFCDALGDNDKIVVTYSAKLNEKAVIADTGNPNETYLEYGDKKRTEKDYTRTYTYKFDVVKYTEKVEGDEKQNLVLNGAKFKLYKNATGEEAFNFVDEGNGVYRVATLDDENATDTILAGKVTIKGLDGGTDYYLEETEAPTGYNKVNGRMKVTLTEEDVNKKTNIGSVEIKGEEGEKNIAVEATLSNDRKNWESGGIGVLNKTGSLLPSTGGIGTTIFYVVGGLMVFAAVVLLVTKKRMSGEKK